MEDATRTYLAALPKSDPISKINAMHATNTESRILVTLNDGGEECSLLLPQDCGPVTAQEMRRLIDCLRADRPVHIDFQQCWQFDKLCCGVLFGALRGGRQLVLRNLSEALRYKLEVIGLTGLVKVEEN